MLRIGNWRRRLVNKTVKYLTSEIEFYCDRSHDRQIFIPYILADFKKEGIWVYNDMVYDIKAN